MAVPSRQVRPLRWIGSSLKDCREFPQEVRERLGFSLFLAQMGLHPQGAKSLQGLGGGMVELIEDFDGDTYRAIYTVRLEAAVYVLHSFKKKSKSGIKTPQKDVDLIRARLRMAETDDALRKTGGMK